jgi:polyhydroxyalkanoate synthesis regulator phasin
MPQPKKPAPAKRASTTKRPSTAKKSTPRSSASATASRSSGSNNRPPAPSPGADALSRLAGLRDLLTKSVMLTGDRIQEVVDDAVSRGRMTRTDAEDLVARLISLGRQQTEDIIGDLEQLLGRGASTSGDRVLQRVDRARRAVGIGTFPILGYDDLSASQVVDRLSDLTPAQLRKVRDHEKRNANRKSILQAIERKLK